MSKKGGGYNLCAALYCNHNRKRNPDLSFFRFPKNPKTCKKWMINAKRYDLLEKDPNYLYSNCILCSEHFEDKVFTNAAKNRLIENAIPTKFSVRYKDSSGISADNDGSADVVEIKPPKPPPLSPFELKDANGQPVLIPKLFTTTKKLLTTKAVTVTSKPKVVSKDVPNPLYQPTTAFQPKIISIKSNVAASTIPSSTVTTAQKPRIIWLAQIPANSGVKVAPALMSPNLVNANKISTIGTALATGPGLLSPNCKPITPGVERDNSILPELIPKVEPQSDASYTNDTDYSYPSSYDGSQYNPSVLQENNSSFTQSYNPSTSYDTNYLSQPPPAKKMKTSSNNELLNDNYEAFSSLVVSKLKSLPPNHAAILQLKIQELLSKDICTLEEEDDEEDDNEEENEEEKKEEGLEDERNESEATEISTRETDPLNSNETQQTEINMDVSTSATETTVQQTTTTTTTSVTIATSKHTKTKTKTKTILSGEDKENNKVYLDDSYNAFSKCIVSQLRYLPIPVAVKTQKKIQKILTDEIIGIHNEKEDTSENSLPVQVHVKEEPIDYD